MPLGDFSGGSKRGTRQPRKRFGGTRDNLRAIPAVYRRDQIASWRNAYRGSAGQSRPTRLRTIGQTQAL